MMKAVLLGCTLLLAQAAGAAPSEEGAVTLALAPAESPLPVLRYGQRTWCVRLEPSPQVPSGRYRVQCDESSQRCLAAPENQLDADGVETNQPLERVQACSDALDPRARAAAGYRFVPAIADSPPGWYRDERGRVMQFNFDLHRRIWLGGGWAPAWRHDSQGVQGRGRVDFGLSADFAEDKVRRRIVVLDTELFLGQESLDITLLRYDSSVRQDTPIVRITTFFGKPRRHDITLDVGTWLEVLRLETLRRASADASFLTIGTAHLTLDLWHSRDLTSYVRVRAGPSAEYDRTWSAFTIVPGAAFEGDFTLDTDGFHHLTFGAEAEKIFSTREVEGRPDSPERLRLRAGYEVILLAINDQPLSFVLDGRGEWRSDLAGIRPVWEWSTHAGLRFSLWAPARRSAPLTPRP